MTFRVARETRAFAVAARPRLRVAARVALKVAAERRVWKA